MTHPIQERAKEIRAKLCIDDVCAFDKGCGCLDVITPLLSELSRLTAENKAMREATIEECAKVADRHADSEAAAGNRAREAGRFGVGSHRDAGTEVAVAIAIKIRALSLDTTKTR